MLRSCSFLAATAVGVAMFVSGCNPEGSPEPVKFTTKRLPIEFTFPKGWYTNTANHPFDLQCFSRRKNMNTAVFAYLRSELPNTPLSDVLQQQIDDMKSKREKFAETEPLRTTEHPDKSITTVTYTGRKDGSENYYRFVLIEFKPKNEVFAVVLQIVVKEDLKESKPIFDAIAASARLLPEPKETATATGSAGATATGTGGGRK